MPADFRLCSNFQDHPKILRLQSRLGLPGVFSWLRLLGFASEYKTDGRLSGLIAEDVALAARWTGTDDFVQTLLDLRLLDREGDTYILHNWAVHQTWLMGAAARQAKARMAQAAKHHKRSGKAQSASSKTATSTPRSKAQGSAPSTTRSKAQSTTRSTAPLLSSPFPSLPNHSGQESAHARPDQAGAVALGVERTPEQKAAAFNGIVAGAAATLTAKTGEG